MRMRARNIVLAIILLLAAAETVYIIKGNSHLSMLRSKRSRLERAIGLSNKGVSLSKQGEYSKALELMEEAMELAPTDSLIGQNLKAVYFNFCVSLIGSGKYQEALDVADNGFKLLSDDPVLMYLKAESFYGLNQIDSAVAYLDKAYAAKPIDREIMDRLDDLNTRCRHEGNLQASRTGYFDIRFEGGENRELAERILYMLEDIRDRQGTLFGWQARKEIGVVLYSDQQFLDITNMASWAGAAFDGKIRIPVAGIRNDGITLDRVLTHEFVHALLFEIGGKKFPGWFSEGLAQYQEGQSNAEAGYIPLTQMRSPFMRLEKEEARKAYGASLSAVKFLIDDNGWDMVRLFVNNMGKGGDFETTFRETFNLSVEQFDQKWKKNIDE
jgi:tetratricopeptide (TPR) repeat protein